MSDTETQKFIESLTPRLKKIWSKAEVDYDSSENVIKFAEKIRDKTINECIEVVHRLIVKGEEYILYKVESNLKQLKENK